ncbi:protein YhfH [Sporosarcina sp. FSL K6-1522]
MEAIKHYTEKYCTECGKQIIEKHESALYECERCIGKHEH